MRYTLLFSIAVSVVVFVTAAFNVDRSYYICKDHKGQTSPPVSESYAKTMSLRYNKVYNKDLVCREVFMSLSERNRMISDMSKH